MLGFGELIVIAFILLLVLGPSRLTNMGPALGKAIRGFKRGLEGVEEDEVEKPAKLADKSVEKDITPPKV